jgi:hypothetical protein
LLRVEKIEFIDQNDQNYTIQKHQIESFPLVGGNDANWITSKVWNQHGNTPINALMDSNQEELIFVLYTADLAPSEIEDKRRQLVNICNPLNGVLTMKVTLNSGNTYSRDITFIAAPSFPTGRENRNVIWQKVLLEFESNNPFWYAEQELVETFQAVEPLFLFPFTMQGKNDVVFGDYAGKIAGSVVENPNKAFRSGTSETLNAPNTITTELDDTQTLTGYPVIATVGGATTLAQTAGFSATLRRIAQHQFAFNVIELLERKYGAAIWEGQTTLAGKITIAKALITKVRSFITGYGTSPTGNKANFAIWNKTTAAWTLTKSHTNAVLTELEIETTDINNVLDDTGFIYFVHYSDPADTATNAVIRADYIQLALSTTVDNNIDPVYMGNILPSNIAINNGQVEAPVIIKIVGACTNPRIDNLTTGEYIKFNNLTMTAGQVLEIDTTFGEKKVTLDGVNIFNKLDYASTFFNLKLGSNEIEFTDDTGSTTAAIHFIYKEMYITI